MTALSFFFSPQFSHFFFPPISQEDTQKSQLMALQLFEPPTKVVPSADILHSIYPLYWKDIFLGSCVAIKPKVLISAGHHYNMLRDNVGDFTVLVKPSRWISVEYASKLSSWDTVVLWLNEPVICTSLRGFLPAINSRVVTVWLSPKPPHEPIFSPGIVVSGTTDNCVAKGTVSTTGSSGSPVVDFHGDHIVGIHLGSNMKNGSRVSDFIPARKLVYLLARINIACR